MIEHIIFIVLALGMPLLFDFMKKSTNVSQFTADIVEIGYLLCLMSWIGYMVFYKKSGCGLCLGFFIVTLVGSAYFIYKLATGA